MTDSKDDEKVVPQTPADDAAPVTPEDAELTVEQLLEKAVEELEKSKARIEALEAGKQAAEAKNQDLTERARRLIFGGSAPTTGGQVITDNGSTKAESYSAEGPPAPKSIEELDFS